MKSPKNMTPHELARWLVRRGACPNGAWRKHLESKGSVQEAYDTWLYVSDLWWLVDEVIVASPLLSRAKKRSEARLANDIRAAAGTQPAWGFRRHYPTPWGRALREGEK